MIKERTRETCPHTPNCFERIDEFGPCDGFNGALAAMPEVCKWSYDEDEDAWGTSCGNLYIIIFGRPDENKMRYCTYCGARIVEGERAK